MAKIFYFTGTGNSLSVAKKIGEEIKGDLVSISDALKTKKSYDDKVIGLVVPVYYADIPDFVIRFLNEVDIPKDGYLFTIVTCADFPGKSINHIKQI